MNVLQYTDASYYTQNTGILIGTSQLHTNYILICIRYAMY